jgi:glyceraldehyde 3-phosphate dehydrogenase
MTTVHALTADQMPVDGPHKAGILSRRGRASAFNIVPSSTGAAKAIGLVLPTLKGKLDGFALRVPTITGSVVDLTVELKRNVTVAEINEAMKAAQSESFKYTNDPIVSSDVIGATQGSIFDALSTQIVEADGKQLVKVLSWYDNEMSYTSQLVRTVKKFASFIK